MDIKDVYQDKLEPTSEVKMLEQAGEVLYKELLDKFKLDNSNILEMVKVNHQIRRKKEKVNQQRKKEKVRILELKITLFLQLEFVCRQIKK